MTMPPKLDLEFCKRVIAELDNDGWDTNIAVGHILSKFGVKRMQDLPADKIDQFESELSELLVGNEIDKQEEEQRVAAMMRLYKKWDGPESE